MPFHGILFDRPGAGGDEPQQPACFQDLNLDQVVAAITAGREEYDLKPFFYAPLHDVGAVTYRHEVLRDLESEPVAAAVKTFARRMREMRGHLVQAEKLRHRHQKGRWFLDAVDAYCGAVGALTEDLGRLDLGSNGLRAFRDELAAYAGSAGFTSLVEETRGLRELLAGVRYAVHIKGNRVRVSRYEDEADYSSEVQQTFAKFKQGAVRDYRVKLPDHPEMNHVEARVLDFVADLYPNVFRALEEYCEQHRSYVAPAVGAFDREVQFYLAYLDYSRRLGAAGLPFCYPRVSDRSKDVSARDAFDIALATALVPERSQVVCNDFRLDDPERILVVTGPNQGGKTTFARMVGQLHYLASLGCLVPAREAALFLPDRVFTHFEREEDLATLRGKLEDELVRIHEVLTEATGQSVIIMNESFTSTTLRDALLLGTEVLERIAAMGALCVYVTFVDELASLGESSVSMVGTVVPDDPATRTFRVVRRPADGLAYAAAIAEKYGLTYERLRRRVAR